MVARCTLDAGMWRIAGEYGEKAGKGDSLLLGRELVLAAYRREAVPRVPWVPFTGVHAAALAGYGATEALLDLEKLVRSALVAYDLYKPDGQPVCFDLQVEAEILGCQLRWADDAPPSVSSHPLAERGYDALGDMRVPVAGDGRLPVILAATAFRLPPRTR